MEEQLCEIDRVRTLYEKYCEKFAQLPQPWIEFATFELNLEEVGRAKDILKIGQQMNVEGLPDPE